MDSNTPLYKAEAAYGLFFTKDSLTKITEAEVFENESIPQMALQIAIRYLKFRTACSRLENLKSLGTALFTDVDEMSEEDGQTLRDLIDQELEELGLDRNVIIPA